MRMLDIATPYTVPIAPHMSPGRGHSLLPQRKRMFDVEATNLTLVVHQSHTREQQKSLFRGYHT